MVFRRLPLTALLGLALACGGGTPAPTDAGPAVSRVDPSSPLGTVWGSVFDASNQAPLAGASVSLSVSGQAMQAQTDAEGSFVFVDVPAGGDAAVTITMDGYTRATASFWVPGETGNFPADGIGAYVGPISLFPTTGTLTVQVVGRDGYLVQGAQAQASVRAAYVDEGRSGQPTGFVTATATTADGIATFTGLPSLEALALYGAQVTVLVSPVDVNADGIIDYVGTSDRRDASWLVTHGGRYTLTLDPPGETSALAPIAGNVGSLFNNGVPRPGDSVVAAGEPVRVVFNQPLDPASVITNIFEEDGETAVGASASVQNGNVLLVTPTSALQPGQKYFVSISALAQGTVSGNQRVQLAGAFFVPATGSSIEVVPNELVMLDRDGNGLLSPGDVVELTLTSAIGLGEGQVGASVWFPGYFNSDLDGTGAGDSLGEWGSGRPFHVEAMETVPPSPFRVTGFTRHFRFVMPSVGAVPYGFTPQTTIPYAFHLDGSEPGYRTLLTPAGAPTPRVEGNFTVTLTLP